MYCQCGCGQVTTIHNWSDKRTGAVKGQHARYIQGHHTRKHGNGDLSAVKWDAVDDEMVRSHRWHVIQPDGKKSYVTTHVNNKTTYMHRMILDAPKGVEVDHVNGDGLDNRRENLRLATRSENAFNTPKRPGTSSRFKGVHWHKSIQKWTAYISKDRTRTNLGTFESETEAAQAYNEAAVKLHGKFAWLNPIE